MPLSLFAHTQQEKLVRAHPDDAGALCMLGLIDAEIGRKEEALREGRRALELLPVQKDAISGKHIIVCLAKIAAWVGDKDLACEQLARARQPSGRLHHLWRVKADAVVGSSARRSVLRKNRRLPRAEIESNHGLHR